MLAAGWRTPVLIRTSQQKKITIDNGKHIQIKHKCDWLWKNLPLTHKDKYLEIRNSIIQSVIS